MSKNDIMGSLYGFVVGDALGVPYEFEVKADMKSLLQYDNDGVLAMVSGGTHNQKKGTWSDDTSLMLAEIVSYNEIGKIEPHDIMNRFIEYKEQGKYTPFGRKFDIGNSTSLAISNYKKTGELVCESLDAFEYCGNGALMRMLPYALMRDIEMEKIEVLSKLTHPYSTCTMYSKLYVLLFKELREGSIENTPDSKYECVSRAIDRLSEEEVISVTDCLSIVNSLDFLYECTEMDKEKFINRVNSKFYVVDTYEAAVGAFIATDNFNDCIECCIRIGNDTDTTAAIAGGIAGFYYGQREISKAWLKEIQRLDILTDAFNKFYKGIGRL